VRIEGQEVNMKPLTVGELRAFLNAQAARDPSIDEDLVHWLRMEGTEDDAGTAYATHVDLDCYDITEEDVEDPAAKAIRVVGLYHWPSRERAA
jgi:hypothetical protein